MKWTSLLYDTGVLVIIRRKGDIWLLKRDAHTRSNNHRSLGRAVWTLPDNLEKLE
ncbi:MAG: hypothetical protein ACFFDH_03390 [Promethearchaeota archaeon]